MVLKLIGISEEIKKDLDNLKDHPRETYNDILVRLLKKDKEVKK